MQTANTHRLRATRVWASAAVAVAMAALGAACAEGRSGTPESRISPAILNTVAASEGITAEAARELLVRQAELMRLADAVAPTLDLDTTAGLYIDQEAGELVVNATVPGASGPKRDGVREARVRYPSSELNRADAVVTATVAQTGAKALTWAIDVRANAVVVAMDPAHAEKPLLTALRSTLTALGPVVRLETAKDIESTVEERAAAEGRVGEVAAGDWAGICSVAWPVTDGQGRDAVLSAGHCVEDGGSAWAHAGWPIGPVTAYDYGPRDFAVVQVDAESGVRLGDRVNFYDGSYGRLTGYSRAPVGSVICKSGAVSRLTCGTITAGRISSASAKTGAVLIDQVGMRMCSDYGDSGGAVFVPRVDGTVTAQGIISSGIEACHPPVGEGDPDIADNGMRYQPVDTVLREQGLILRTARPGPR